MKTVNKTVLITGASLGIGAACAKRFAKEGYNVVVNYNSSENEAKALEKEFSNMVAVKADLSKEVEAKALVEETVKRFNKIDVLVNNAGIALESKLFTDTTRDDWDKIFNTNVFGMFNVTKAAVSHMVHEKSGAIINISSIWGITGASCEVVYSASKGAVNSFTKALSKELAPSNIRVNAIAPGVIDTKMNAFLSNDEKKALEEEIPLGRFGNPSEIASAVYFLASEDSSYITGQIITADGGFIGV